MNYIRSSTNEYSFKERPPKLGFYWNWPLLEHLFDCEFWLTFFFFFYWIRWSIFIWLSQGYDSISLIWNKLFTYFYVAMILFVCFSLFFIINFHDFDFCFTQKVYHYTKLLTFIILWSSSYLANVVLVFTPIKLIGKCK